MTPAIYPLSHFVWPFWPQRDHGTLSSPLQNPDILCLQYSQNPSSLVTLSKNGNEVSLAGNKVSLATDGEILNNVGANSPELTIQDMP